MEVDRAIVAETSASFLSNVFRYKMIAQTGAIWIDCDAYCYRPFPEVAGAYLRRPRHARAR
jgi:mannosyltransferase OCH1-like enzyme